MKWILRSDIPPIWSQKDEKWTWISHMNELYRFRYTPLASAMKSTWTSDNNLYVQMKCSYSDIPPLSDEVHMDMRYQFIFCNCPHFATDHLHDYIQFTIYHLEVHFQCCDTQEISVISSKTCTLKLQLLHNT